MKETDVVIFDTAWDENKTKKGRGKEKGMSAFCMLFGIAAVTTGCFLSAFGVKPFWLLLLVGLPGMTILFTAFFLAEKLDGYRLPAGLLLFALYGGVCFWKQEQIIGGFYGVGTLIYRRINQVYSGNLSLPTGGTKMEMTAFLLAVLFPLVAALGAGIVKKQRMLPVVAVLFPVLSLTAVAGGSPSVWWLILLVIALAALAAASGSCLRGGKTALFAGLIACAVSALSWFVIRPVLEKAPLETSKPAAKFENRLLQSLYRILPRISGGALNLSLEGIGGGVEDGTLGATDGYYFTGVEALKVTSLHKPEDTVYLKGFVGSQYTGSSFEAGDEKAFVNAASSWKTEGDAALYIENLPFLRMMYYENYGEEGTSGETVGANTITVENLSANPQYTYVPYYAFLNSYYQIYGGDGYVGGQTLQDDIFPCFGRGVYRNVMENWRDKDTAGGVLDRLEESYRGYCFSQDLQIPKKGLERLKKECEKKAEEEKWSCTFDSSQPLWAQADETEEIRRYILKRLLTSCKYELDVDALPKGEDFITHFLYGTKEGYSMHFAAAATMMFRMFGVPARYVVGYAAPGEMFTPDENGTYTAILQDDNAHAWTEIYMPFLGWTPVEVTPGMEGEFLEDTYLEEEKEDNVKEAAAKEPVEDKAGFWERVRDIAAEYGVLFACTAAILAVAGMCIGFLARIIRARRYRLGTGLDKPGRVRAVYHSMYRLLVLSKMPEEYSIMPSTGADGMPEEGRTVYYLEEQASSWSREEIMHLQKLILQACYGAEEVKDEDVAWMYAHYRSLYRQLKRKIPFRKKAVFFLEKPAKERGIKL